MKARRRVPGEHRGAAAGSKRSDEQGRINDASERGGKGGVRGDSPRPGDARYREADLE